MESKSMRHYPVNSVFSRTAAVTLVEKKSVGEKHKYRVPLLICIV